MQKMDEFTTKMQSEFKRLGIPTPPETPTVTAKKVSANFVEPSPLILALYHKKNSQILRRDRDKAIDNIRKS